MVITGRPFTLRPSNGVHPALEIMLSLLKTYSFQYRPARRLHQNRCAKHLCVGTVEVPDVFVVGYGIDYAGAYRNLRDIHALGPRTAEG